MDTHMPGNTLYPSESKLGPNFYSPMALLLHWETKHSDHQHLFKTIHTSPAEENKESISYLNKENDIPYSTTPSISDTLSTITSIVTSRYICQICHCWLTIEHSPNTTGCNELYPCHHYHTNQLESYYQCCGCDYTMAIDIVEAALPMIVLKQLEADRPKGRTMVDIMQNKAQETPTVVSTLTVLATYIHDLLKGVRKNINSLNANVIARVGTNQMSQLLLEYIGFTLQDTFFVPPVIEKSSPAEHKLQRIYEEIIMSLESLRQELGGPNVPMPPGSPVVKTPDIHQILGIIPTMESSYVSNDNYINKAYAILGLTSGASDVLVNWTYRQLITEPANMLDPHTAMDALTTIANHTNSSLLITQVALEHSRGVIGRNDIGDAYAYFGVTEETADDKLLIGLYQIKCSDEPQGKSTHRDKLKIIGIARESTPLLQFLQEEHSIKDSIGVPAHLVNMAQEIPVGLNNIGNTCYFNSLMQYYYTLLPFRHAMIHNEQFVEEEDSEPKKIGGINVDQSEIRRAKKFVSLMKNLFVNLQQTTEKAISPEYELAYMALLNEKEEDKVTEDTPMDGKNEWDMPQDTPPLYEDIINESPIQDTKESVVKERPSVDAMLFGRQQDVTECMAHVMYLVEAALKPLSKTEDGEQVDDLIRQLFYGKARQILSYCDNTTLKDVKKEMEEDFSHVIIDGCKSKDLYDGLDEYFFADKVENFQGGHEATREVSVKSFPPILQILVQRVQFNRATSNVYKSNEYIQFDKTIYVDRYSDKNFEALKDKRAEVAEWRIEYEEYQKEVDKYTKEYQMPVPDLLEATTQLLEEYMPSLPDEDQIQLQKALEIIKRESEDKKRLIEHHTQKMRDIKHRIHTQYDDYKEKGYNLHAVFIHQGQANYGHYWIYIYDHKENQWWKYNDSFVTKVKETEVFQDTTGSTANPYFLVYVDATRVNEYVETIVKHS